MQLTSRALCGRRDNDSVYFILDEGGHCLIPNDLLDGPVVPGKHVILTMTIIPIAEELPIHEEREHKTTLNQMIQGSVARP